MNIKRRKPRSSKKRRRPHGRCCPCLLMCGIAGLSLESCHFYTDLGCFCCNVRSARPDGRDLREHLKWMPESLDVQRSHFRFHGWKALAAERAASWDCAILHYEACRQVLSEVEEKLPGSLHLWLLMWASAPLVSLYHLASQNFVKSIEISESLMRCLHRRMAIGLQCWNFVCSRNPKFRYRCRLRLSRILMELRLAYDALDRDRSLAYYEWSHECPVIDDHEEKKRKVFEGIDRAEHTLCHWLSKLYKQYGDLGRALHWASLRESFSPQCPNHDHHDEEHWKLEMYDAELLSDCGDAQGFKDKVFALREKLAKRPKRQDGRHFDPEALVAVEDVQIDIGRYYQFYGDLPVKQGTKLQFRTMSGNERSTVTSNRMDIVAHDGLKLKSDFEKEKPGTVLRSLRFDAAVSFYRVALDELARRKRHLRDKNCEHYRLDFLDKLATLFEDHYHEDGLAMEDLDSLIHYNRKLYFHTWMMGSRADKRILGAQASLGRVYGILALLFFNANEFLHDQDFDSTGFDFIYWHIVDQIGRVEVDKVVKYEGLGPKEPLGESEMKEWVDQKYRGSFITGFIKAWRRSMKHNKIAAVMGSNILHSLRDSSHQLDDTWAIYSLSDQDTVYDGLQARIEEERKMKCLLATCCKGVPVKKKILKYMDRNLTSSGPTPKSLPSAFGRAGEKARTCCEGFAGDGRPVNSMHPAQEALLWAERNRTCTLVQQLLPNRLHRAAFDNLHKFDLQDQVAWNIISEAKVACGKEAVIVEYSYCHYDQSFLAYVFHQDGLVEMRGLPFEDEADMVESVGEVLEILGIGDDDEFEARRPELERGLTNLYSILISPIADCLEPMAIEDKLVIVPFEGLFELPFQLLLDEGGKYLFEKFVPCIAPSLRTIKYLSDRLCTLQGYSLQNGEACLVVGDAAFRKESDRLLKSKKEVHLIGSIFEEKDIKKLLGTEASVQKVLDWGRRPSDSSDQHGFCQAFVHIATHGHVNATYTKGALRLAHPKASEWEQDSDEDSGMSSNEYEAAHDHHMNAAVKSTEDGISWKVDSDDAVAAQPAAEIGGVMKRRFRNGPGGASKDGPDFLSSDGIIGCGFDWRAYMVVLSACDSGKGKLLSEGVLNLPRAFLIAGVPCVVASQWPVDDDLTPEVMEEFYACMKRGSDVATALSLSMRLVKDRREKDVHKWGTFNVWGLPTVCLPKELQAGYIDPPSSSISIATTDDAEH